MNTKVMPLLSWDIFIDFYFDSLDKMEKRCDIKVIYELARKFKWNNDIDTIINDIDYEAVVITDMNQKIIWVNDGFTEMTGYSKRFALNKQPSFLQGEATSETTKAKIRKKLKLNKPFKETVINYKKDKTPYKCEVQIFPLYTYKTTHYIALERQVS